MLVPVLVTILMSCPCLPGLTADISQNRGQQVFVGLEIGLPYDLANTLNNPLGEALTAVSVLAVAAIFFFSILWVPYSTMGLQGRRRRSAESRSTLFHVEDGLWLLQDENVSCRKRVVLSGILSLLLLSSCR